VTEPNGSGHADGPFAEFLYPFLDERGDTALAEVLAQVRASTLQKSAEVIALRRASLAEYAGALVAAAQDLARAFAAGGQLLACGNGGSATDAQDLAADCLHPAPGRAALPALSLTNDIGVVTAVGNDVGFDNVFARQVIALGRPGDIAVGFSTSGQSPNVLAALLQARKQGLLTLAFAGYDGGALARAGLDHCFVVRSSYIPRIQEAQASLYHGLLELTRTLLEASPS
jgi:D-sedoheptulose 7-phosphate isomerase